MAKKKNTDPVTVVLSLAIVLVLCVFIFFGIKYAYEYFILNKHSNNDSNNNDNHVSEVVTNGEISVEIGDYTVYEDNLDELGFNFLVAELKFTTTGSSIYVDLSDFVTSERTNLGQLEFYTSKLTEKTYDYKKLGVTSTVSSDTSSCSATVLIPYTNAKGELKVYYNSEVLKFALSNFVNAETLKPGKEIKDNVIKDDQTDKEVYVSEAYVSNMMLHNGEDYDASAICVYTYKIRVAKINDNVKIENAIFIKEGSGYEYEALDESYKSYKIDNIIGKTLKSGDEYALFFELYRNGNEEINYDGVLRIKFSDSDKWVEIPTTLR